MICSHPECNGNHNGSGSVRKADLCPAAHERRVAAKANWIIRQQERLNAIKVERGCIDCGYNSAHEALDFDHLPMYTKLGDISTLVRSRPWKIVEAEINKCEVRCANCHRVMTARRAGR